MADEEKAPQQSTTFIVGDVEVDAWGNEAQSDEEVGYDSWTAKQLMSEIDNRNKDRAEGDQIVLEGKKKSDAVAALEKDDQAHAAEEE